MDDSAEQITRELLAHRDDLYAYALALTGDPLVAEEAFQDLGVAVLEALDRGTRPRNFPAWVRTLLRHRIADHFRRERRHRHRLRRVEALAEVAEEAFAERPGPDDAEERARDARLLRECMEGLAPKARELIEHRYLADRSNGAIATAMNWSRDAVKVGLSRARRSLRECVERRRAATGGGDV